MERLAQTICGLWSSGAKFLVIILKIRFGATRFFNRSRIPKKPIEAENCRADFDRVRLNCDFNGGTSTDRNWTCM